MVSHSIVVLHPGADAVHDLRRGVVGGIAVEIAAGAVLQGSMLIINSIASINYYTHNCHITHT